MSPATTLQRAIDVLQPEPISPDGNPWYVEPSISLASGRSLHPLASLRAQMLRSRVTDRFFLSGHIGSGKSTELRRLLADIEVKRRFYVVSFSVSPAARANLTSHQLLFLIAAELYQRAANDEVLTRFDKKDRWQPMLQRMDAALYGPTGLAVVGGKLGLSFDLFFVKLSQELNVQQARRTEFSKLAETQGGALVDLINALVDDIESALVHAGFTQKVLVAIDDVDKVAKPEQLVEIFETNLGAFLAPEVAILTTVPAHVTFGGTSTQVGPKVTHIRPIQVLKKVTAADPAAAADSVGVAMLGRVLAARVAPGLFAPRVIEEAAIYSGGVIRDFFGLLRTAAILGGDIYGQPTVDEIAFHDVLVDETNKLARTLFPVDKEALRQIHGAHTLSDPAQHKYMASTVLEYNHDGIWWEVSPMLWEWLKEA